MELTHTFTVPVDRDTAWAAFQDIGSVAECFPGASVTSTEGDSFKGTVKVKLGPIALQYAGSGEFVDRDATAYRMAIKARGRDKRGNGTAGAAVVATFADAGGGSTRVEVATDLNITGRPAQFGRGVIQDVSDRLLGQFVQCLESKVAPPVASVQPQDAAAPSSAVAPVSGPLTVPDEIAVPGEVAAPGDSWFPDNDPDDPVEEPVDEPPGAPSPSAAPGAGGDDALDLGATVLPVLLRTYAKQLVAGGLVLLVLLWLLRRRR